MTKTRIDWADEVWNPTTGCTKVSEGCRHCYAERVAGRFWKGRKFSEVRLHPERLEEPLHWRKPRMVFVDSMSDFFHLAVPFEFIDQVGQVISRCKVPHIFMILTKRPARMLEYFSDRGNFTNNVWLGVSVEDQKAADERIPLLLQTPAAVRFISVEPMLGAVNIKPYLYGWSSPTPEKDHGIDWVICGGESGPSARPMHEKWARSLRDQCQAARIPFFFKQWGEMIPTNQATFGQRQSARRIQVTLEDNGNEAVANESLILRKGNTGHLLDGVEWRQYPDRLKNGDEISR